MLINSAIDIVHMTRSQSSALHNGYMTTSIMWYNICISPNNKQNSNIVIFVKTFYVIFMIPKLSLEAIFLGGGLISGGLLANLGINDNKITSGIPNYIPSPSNLRYVAKKSRQAKFIRIKGFEYNYPCSMSFNKVERDGLGCMLKEIDFWDV